MKQRDYHLLSRDELEARLDLALDLVELGKLEEIIQRLDFQNNTLNALSEQIGKIMSAVTDFAAKVQANQDKISADLDSLKTEISGLNDSIQALQNSQGQLGPSDQAALDDIATKSQALQDKADALVVPAVPTPPTP